MELVVLRQGFAKRYGEGEGLRQGKGVRLLSLSPSLYIGEGVEEAP